MAKDRLADIEQTFDRRNVEAAKLEKTEGELETKRAKVREILVLVLVFVIGTNVGLLVSPMTRDIRALMWAADSEKTKFWQGHLACLAAGVAGIPPHARMCRDTPHVVEAIFTDFYPDLEARVTRIPTENDADPCGPRT